MPTRRPIIRQALAVALMCSCAIGVGAGVRTALADAPPTTPQVSVTPATELVQGQNISVSWTGFTGDQIFLYECGPGALSLSTDCFHVSKSSPTRSDGTGADVISVTTGLITSTVTCDAQHPCALYAVPGVSSNDLSTGVSTPLMFAKGKEACPTAAAEPAGVGSHAADRAFVAWLPVVCQAPLSSPIDWTTKNDVEGRQSFTSAQVDYAVTESPLSATQLARLPSPTTIGYAPISLSAIGFAYNIRDASTGERITDLHLSADLLTLIFTGQLQTWQDPRVQSLNPGHTFPSNIKVVVRADQNWQSLAVTSWFSAVDNDTYLAGGTGYSGGPSEIYPNTLNSPLYPATEEPAVVRAVTNPENIPNNDGYQPDSQGVIGFMDTSAAAVAALPVVTLVNDSGLSIAPNADSLSAAYDAMTVNPDGTRTPDYAGLNKGYYPLPDLTNLLVATTGPRVKTTAVKALKGFLDYVQGAGQGAALPAGYVPLPTSARAQVVQVATAIIASQPKVPQASTPSRAKPVSKPTVIPAPVIPPAPIVEDPAPVVPQAAPSIASAPVRSIEAQPAPVAFSRESSSGSGLGLLILTITCVIGFAVGTRLMRTP